MMMGKPGWGYHYTPCNPGSGKGSGLGAFVAVAAGVAGAVWVLDQVAVYLLIGAGAFAVLMVPVLAWMIRAGHGTPPWLRETVPARVTLRAAPERRASIEAPQLKAIEGRVVVTGSAATVPMSPARRTAGRREWQGRR